MVINVGMVTVLLLGLVLHTTLSSLPPECLVSGPGPPQLHPGDGGDRTNVMLGYLTAVRGSMNNRQVGYFLLIHLI